MLVEYPDMWVARGVHLRPLQRAIRRENPPPPPLPPSLPQSAVSLCSRMERRGTAAAEMSLTTPSSDEWMAPLLLLLLLPVVLVMHGNAKAALERTDERMERRRGRCGGRSPAALRGSSSCYGLMLSVLRGS